MKDDRKKKYPKGSSICCGIQQNSQTSILKKR